MNEDKQASEYLVKLAAVKELESAVKSKRAFEDLVHSFLGLLRGVRQLL